MLKESPTIYEGEHDAIVELELWDRVNGELRAARRSENGVIRLAQNAWLKGLLFCGNCDQAMVPTYTSKGDRRYRYYVANVRVGGYNSNFDPFVNNGADRHPPEG